MTDKAERAGTDGTDDGRLILPRPSPVQRESESDASSDPAVPVYGMVERPWYRRLVLGGVFAVVIGVPLLVAFLYANDAIDVDPASVWAMVAVCEALWIANLAWWWWWHEHHSHRS